ncbi:MAG: VOC family protein [Alphaproteobacteria bacterium]|nr:MAG: VOC family protein [Alphaproteobacteria bacterium]
MTSDENRIEGGHPPLSGWQPMVCEILVEDIAASLAFWRDLVGFHIAYDRKAEKFAYLERLLPDRRGAQVMLAERNGRWETGPMVSPFGRGVMFQICVEDLAPILAALDTAGWPLHSPLRDIWRETGDHETGQREVFVLDPDGYLLMLYQDLGDRPLKTARQLV